MKIVARTIRDLRARREQLAQELAGVYADLPGHISDHDLERYHLGMVTDEAELAPLEEHLLWCEPCGDRAEAAAQYVDAVRAACERADWATFPEPLECPEIPRTPAAILERVGKFPNWRGERPLRDTLEPVYDAASRYALEHVFGRK